MKKFVSVKSVLVTIFMLSATIAHASPRSLNCVLGGNQGFGKLEVANVEGHPDLSVFTIQMTTKLARYPKIVPGGSVVGLAGQLIAKVTSQKIEARGNLTLDFGGSGSNNLNLPVALYGRPQLSGAVAVQLIDRPEELPAGYLQLGYGVMLICQ